MHNRVESNESSCGEEFVVGIRATWSAPRLRKLNARLAEADHGGTHFDGLGFVS